MFCRASRQDFLERSFLRSLPPGLLHVQHGIDALETSTATVTLSRITEPSLHSGNITANPDERLELILSGFQDVAVRPALGLIWVHAFEGSTMQSSLSTNDSSLWRCGYS
jgi:hypothetical protein